MAEHVANRRAADLVHAMRDSDHLRIAAIEIHTEAGDTYQAFTCPRRGRGYDLVRLNPASGRAIPMAPPTAHADCWELGELVRFLESARSAAESHSG